MNALRIEALADLLKGLDQILDRIDTSMRNRTMRGYTDRMDLDPKRASFCRNNHRSSRLSNDGAGKLSHIPFPDKGFCTAAIDLFSCSSEKNNISLERLVPVRQQLDRRRESKQARLHIPGAAAIHHPIHDFGSKRIVRPARTLTDRHHIGMAIEEQRFFLPGPPQYGNQVLPVLSQMLGGDFQLRTIGQKLLE